MLNHTKTSLLMTAAILAMALLPAFPAATGAPADVTTSFVASCRLQTPTSGTIVTRLGEDVTEEPFTGYAHDVVRAAIFVKRAALGEPFAFAIKDSTGAVMFAGEGHGGSQSTIKVDPDIRPEICDPEGVAVEVREGMAYADVVTAIELSPNAPRGTYTQTVCADLDLDQDLSASECSSSTFSKPGKNVAPRRFEGLPLQVPLRIWVTGPDGKLEATGSGSWNILRSDPGLATALDLNEDGVKAVLGIAFRAQTNVEGNRTSWSRSEVVPQSGSTTVFNEAGDVLACGTADRTHCDVPSAPTQNPPPSVATSNTTKFDISPPAGPGGKTFDTGKWLRIAGVALLAVGLAYAAWRLWPRRSFGLQQSSGPDVRIPDRVGQGGGRSRLHVPLEEGEAVLEFKPAGFLKRKGTKLTVVQSSQPVYVGGVELGPGRSRVIRGPALLQVGPCSFRLSQQGPQLTGHIGGASAGGI